MIFVRFCGEAGNLREKKEKKEKKKEKKTNKRAKGVGGPKKPPFSAERFFFLLQSFTVMGRVWH